MAIWRKIFLISTIFIFLAPQPSLADEIDPSATGYGLNDPSFKQLSINQDSDLKGTIASIINIVLGLLGIVAVVIIMFGGFKWMTAAGNEEQVSQARKMIVDGVIGLAVIFLAWTIATFAINQLLKATGSENGAPGSAAPAPDTPGQANSLTSGGAGNSQAGGLLAGNSGNQSDNSSLNQAGTINSQVTDSDGDGLTNTEELNVYHTDPNKSDTDGDGFTDGAEAQNGYSPAGAGKIVDDQNSQSCSSLLPLLAGALGNAAKLADAQKQIKDCCAQKQDPLCAGF